MIQEQIPAEKLAVFFEVIKEINRLVDEQNSKAKETLVLENEII
jgi:hypothetical protein